jgi:subtilisin family serine protease
MLQFATPKPVDRVSWRATGTLAAVLTADPGAIAAVAPGVYALPVRVAVPTASRSVYSGALQLTTAGRPLEEALAITIVVTPPSSTVVPVGAAAPSADRIVDLSRGQSLVRDEVVVLVDLDAADPDQVAKSVALETGGTFIGSVGRSRTYQVRYSVKDVDALRAIRDRVATLPGVATASFNTIAREPLSVYPNDTEWEAWSSTSGGNNWAMEAIRAPNGWDVTTGSSSVRVGVVDTDFDQNHGDIDDNVGRISGRGASAKGHGTHVSGTICAEGNNARGVTGMMWACDLRLFPYGSDSVTTQQSMVDAVDDGARVVNLSLQFVENNQCGTPGTQSSLELVADTNAVLGRALLYAPRAGHDVLWVFAAGNECRDAEYASPASLVREFPENVITVASVDNGGALSSSSNRGSLVTVAAPGGSVYSTLPRSCIFGLFCKDNYGLRSGTSMAAPHVTGLAGLLFSKDLSMTAVKVKSCIVVGAQSAGANVSGEAFKVIDVPSALSCGSSVILPAKVDLVLSLDLTGSMGGVLNRVKSQMNQAIDDLRAAAPGTDFRFAVTSYEDYPLLVDSTVCGTSTYRATYGSGADQPFRISQALTSDAVAVTATVNGLNLGDGEDGPESYGRALWEVAQADTGAALGFRSDALKLLVNFGDNVPHDPDINEGVTSPTRGADTGIDPGRNGTVDCGADDIDFQMGALEALKTAGIPLLQVDSSGGGEIEPYWRLWTSRTGGAYTSLAPTDGRTLSEVIIDLLGLIPSTSTTASSAGSANSRAEVSSSSASSSATGLVILSNGNDAAIERIIAEEGGRITNHVTATGTYTVDFPGKSPEELRRQRDELRNKGLDARLLATLPTP